MRCGAGGRGQGRDYGVRCGAWGRGQGRDYGVRCGAGGRGQGRDYGVRCRAGGRGQGRDYGGLRFNALMYSWLTSIDEGCTHQGSRVPYVVILLLLTGVGPWLCRAERRSMCDSWHKV